MSWKITPKGWIVVSAPAVLPGALRLAAARPDPRGAGLCQGYLKCAFTQWRQPMNLPEKNVEISRGLVPYLVNSSIVQYESAWGDDDHTLFLRAAFSVYPFATSPVRDRARGRGEQFGWRHRGGPWPGEAWGCRRRDRPSRGDEAARPTPASPRPRLSQARLCSTASGTVEPPLTQYRTPAAR
jgi:hypothetical protein